MQTIKNKLSPVFGNPSEPLALRLRKVEAAHRAAVQSGHEKNEGWPEYYADCLGEPFVSWALGAYNPCKPQPCDVEVELPSDRKANWSAVDVGDADLGYNT